MQLAAFKGERRGAAQQYGTAGLEVELSGDAQRRVPLFLERAPIVPDILPDNDNSDDPGYGYLWWIEWDGSDGVPFVYAGRGYGGQFLFVAPELRLITVFTGWNIFGQQTAGIRLFLERILPAVSPPPPLPPDRSTPHVVQPYLRRPLRVILC